MRKFWTIWVSVSVIVPGALYAWYAYWMEAFLMSSAKGMTSAPATIQDVPGWGTVAAVGTYGLAAYLVLMSLVLIGSGIKFNAIKPARVTVVFVWTGWVAAWAFGY